MSKWTLQQLDADLRSGKVLPVYVIVGLEEYLVAQCVADIRKACGDAASITSWSAREADAVTVFDTLRTVPMMGGRPLVILRDAEKLPKELQEQIASYVANPVPSATLVIAGSKLDGRSKLMQQAGKHAPVVECKPLYSNQVPSWVTMEIRRRGKEISRETSQFLADLVGTDLGVIASRLDQLCLYVGDKRLIEVADVEVAVADTNQRSSFELADAVGNRDRVRALKVLSRLMEHGEQPVMVLGIIARQLRILMKAQEVRGRMPEQQTAHYLGVHPFFVKDYLKQCANFTPMELRHGFAALSRCDRALKSSRLPRHQVLEKLVWKLSGR